MCGVAQKGVGSFSVCRMLEGSFTNTNLLVNVGPNEFRLGRCDCLGLGLMSLKGNVLPTFWNRSWKRS
jgi:hypothetical protein